MKQIILTAVLTAVLTSIMTAGTIYFVASRMPDQARTQVQPAAEEQVSATPPAERLAEQMAEHLAKAAEPSAAAEAPHPAQVVKLPITREAFEKLVIGKTRDQVVRMVGEPVRRGDLNSLDSWWWYENTTINPVGGKTDVTSLWIVGGIADHVTYNNDN